MPLKKLTDRLCDCGCGQRVYRFGNYHCRFAAGHTMRRLRDRDIYEAVKAKVEMQPLSGCWLWRGKVTRGYAVCRHGGKARTMLHRFFYIHMIGPVPDGLVVDHLCRNKNCLNVAHLEPVTQAENIRRAVPWRKRKAA